VPPWSDHSSRWPVDRDGAPLSYHGQYLEIEIVASVARASSFHAWMPEEPWLPSNVTPSRPASGVPAMFVRLRLPQHVGARYDLSSVGRGVTGTLHILDDDGNAPRRAGSHPRREWHRRRLPERATDDGRGLQLAGLGHRWRRHLSRQRRYLYLTDRKHSVSRAGPHAHDVFLVTRCLLPAPLCAALVGRSVSARRPRARAVHPREAR
jgi:hypothetical protein